MRLSISFILLGFATFALGADDFDAWVLNRGLVTTIGSPAEKRLPVGSLQKPFLIRAWAEAHAREAPPRVACFKTSGCWRPEGHGTLDLRAAIRESCNTYFKQLARDTPAEAIRASFSEAGFGWAGEMSEAESIGLPGPAGVTVAPGQLLASYTGLIRTPWARRDDVRRALIEGMKEAVQTGTAAGLRLWGFMAKTGTVPALDGAPLQTSGLAMVVDDGGFAFLGLLRRGTGREAAMRAGDAIVTLRTGLSRRPTPPSNSSRGRPSPKKRDLDDAVRVRMLGELRLEEIQLRNVGAGPVDSTRGFVGPGAANTPAPGDEFGQGLWEITARKPEFKRRVRAAISVEKREGPMRLVATMSARDYANGVLKAELGGVSGALRTQLASTVLRFLKRGPRHAEADVCDSTHCSWFVGQGPVPRWVRPDLANHEHDMAADLSDPEWSQAVRDARAQPNGTDLWSADCGGAPASPHFIWGGGDRRVTACPRHPKASGRLWRREWPAADLAAVFGAPPEAVDVTIIDGQWFLKVRLPGREPSRNAATLTLTYDDVHSRLATRMGWDALPAPASRVTRTAAGFVAEGTGLGHRVGLCLTK